MSTNTSQSTFGASAQPNCRSPSSEPRSPFGSMMSRPRPYTRRFYLDRNDLEDLCGAKCLARLRSKIPQTIIEEQHGIRHRQAPIAAV